VRAVALRGWTLVRGPDLVTALAGWRHLGRADVADGTWHVASPVHPSQPIGTACRVVVIPADSEVDLIPGSQGMPLAPPPGFRPLRVRAVGGAALVLDARCWFRIADRGGQPVVWEIV
jgi:hypothetical protein